MSHRSARRTRPAALRFVGYVRVSKEEPEGPGLSLTAQRERLAAWAVAHGHELVGVHEDVASGSRDADRRPGLTAALKVVKAHKADGLVVVRLDRLGRKTTGVLELLAASRKQGWKFASVSELIDTTTPAGELAVTMLAAIAQYERQVISARTVAVFAARRAKGQASGSRIPFGYRLEGAESLMVRRKGDDRPLVPYPPEKAVLDRMVALRDKGTSYPVITAQLNASGSLNPRTGKAWSQGVVYAILQTRARWAKGA